MNTSHLRVPAFLISCSLYIVGCAANVDDTNDANDANDADISVEETTAAVSKASPPEACVPACESRKCGLDPVCGVSCGSCGVGEACDERSGHCTASCVPDCSGRTCGADPVCGVSCGSCGVGAVCDESSGRCNAACVPDCSGRICGLDPRCGTSCGSCEADAACGANGQCVQKHAPIAGATVSNTVSCDPTTGSGSVVLDGSKSSDRDGDSLQFAWTEGTKLLASVRVATVSLGVGTHSITLTVTDATGLTAGATASVTVAKSAPIFTSSLTDISLATCSIEAPVSVPIPTAIDRCAVGSVTVTGEAFSKNGTKSSIPVTSGTVTLPADTSTVRWSARADGLTTTADQVVSLTEKWGVFAAHQLDIADGARIIRSSGGYGLVVNSGTAATSAGVEAQLGAILSAAPVTLRDRAKVFGSVTTASKLTRLNNVWIRDAVSERASLSLPITPSLPSSIPSSSTDVTLEPDRLKPIAAGTYRKVSVASRSTLRLATGTYYMDSLDLEPQATLALDGSGAVQIFVRSSVIFRGTIADPKNTPGNVQINYLGTNAVYLEAPFFGVLAAPKASMTLRAVSTPHVGAFFAKDIVIDAHATVTVRPSGCP